jgi:hypothetical protein
MKSMMVLRGLKINLCFLTFGTLNLNLWYVKLTSERIFKLLIKEWQIGSAVKICELALSEILIGEYGVQKVYCLPYRPI